MPKRLLLLLSVALGYLPWVARADAPPIAARELPPEAVRRDFLKVIDRPRVELAAEEHAADAAGGLKQIAFSYATEASQRVPGILVEPAGAEATGAAVVRLPVVIVMHGTGGKKESEVGWLKELAGKGIIGVAIDGRYHGERGNQTEYNAAIAKAFKDHAAAGSGADGMAAGGGGGEHPLYFDTVWDAMRLIDYLQTRSDVDPRRIGVMGISKGGIETYLTAAADPRVAVAVPCIGMQSFHWALEHDGWRGRVGTVSKGFGAALKEAGKEKADADFVRLFYDRVIPGMYGEFDGPVMVKLIAPRPLLIINGDSDDKTPLTGVNECADAARAAYGAAGAEEKFRQIVEPKSGHTVTREAHEAAMAWFEKWMKAGDAGAEKH